MKQEMERFNDALAELGRKLVREYHIDVLVRYLSRRLSRGRS